MNTLHVSQVIRCRTKSGAFLLLLTAAFFSPADNCFSPWKVSLRYLQPSPLQLTLCILAVLVHTVQPTWTYPPCLKELHRECDQGWGCPLLCVNSNTKHYITGSDCTPYLYISFSWFIKHQRKIQVIALHFETEIQVIALHFERGNILPSRWKKLPCSEEVQLPLLIKDPYFTYHPIRN